jgi:hypothetical protein
MTYKRGKITAACIVGIMGLSLLAGCGQAGADTPQAEAQVNVFTSEMSLGNVSIEDEAVALAEAPSSPTLFSMPQASGTLVKENDRAQIDYSNTKDGYVMVRYSAASDKKLKSQVKGPSGTTYTYNLKAGATEWETFPLSDENGEYKVIVYQNTSGSKYATVLSVTFSVEMADPFAPFLRPNQYVNYETGAENTVAKAKELCDGKKTTLDKIRAVYNFVVTTLTYDKEKAANVQSGYLPVLDEALETKKGICFDYAAMMAGMLRSQGIPCKLIVGYAGSAYHSWLNVYTEESGWINSAVFFDGTTWKLMDPTFASSGNQSSDIMKYIGDGSNYTSKYIY